MEVALMKFLVTGATGQLGSLVIEQLLKTVPASDVVASVRDPKKAEHLSAQGVEVREGDFARPETLSSAFAGIDKLLMISTSPGNRVAEQQAAIDAAKAAGVSFIAYTSAPNAQESTFFLTEDHRQTENALIASGITYAILRNNWYLENEMGTIQAALQGAPWLTSAGTGKVGWAIRRDYAEAAANVLTHEGHNNKVYELSGPLLTQEELAAILAEVSGKDIPVQQVDDATYEQVMKEAGVPVDALPFVVGIQTAIREGSLAVDSQDFQNVLGHSNTPLSEGFRDILKQS